MKKEGKPLMHGASAVCSFFEEFTKIWEASNGPTLLAEAQEQQKITEEIYKKIGATAWGRTKQRIGGFS